jgi:hypothetical protein
MRRSAFIAVLFALGLVLAGCVSTGPSSGSCATTRPAYVHVPADGRNLAPELQQIFGSDPNWPMDIDSGGGGGMR